MSVQDLTTKMAFLAEIDRLKTILRASEIIDQSRHENSAEHSWHLAMFALTLSDYAKPQVDITRVIKMLLLHDIVEIDAGDVPLHMPRSQAERDAHEARERDAANRLFGLAGGTHGPQFLALWTEFEAAQTDDAQFAKALDRLQPLVLNLHTDGGTWVSHHVTKDQLVERVGTPIKRASPALWDWAEARIAEYFDAQAENTPPN